MPSQYGAVTGRKRKSSLVDQINARVAYLPARKAVEEDRRYREDILAETRRSNAASEALERDSLEDAKKAAMVSNTVQGIGTVGMGAYLAKKAGLLGAGKAASTAAAAGAGEAIMTGASSSLPAVSGEAVTAGEALTNAGVVKGAGAGKGFLAAAGPVAAAAGLALTHDNMLDWTEEQVGTSGRHAAGIAGRTAQGALLGSVVPGVGTAVGAAVGATVGVVEESWGWIEEQTPVGQASNWADEHLGCVIVTACTNPKSEAVNITREYRDKYMDQNTLRGYYMLAEWLVPIMHRRPIIKRWVKNRLVDRLIAVGKYWLRKQGHPGALALLTTQLFLGFCRGLGRTKHSFSRTNGEVV